MFEECLLGVLSMAWCTFTRSYTTKNEIYDLFIKPEASQQGYELALLGKAIELNKPHQMMVVVDVDAKAEIELYTAAGFNRMEGQNSITASYQSKAI